MNAFVVYILMIAICKLFVQQYYDENKGETIEKTICFMGLFLLAILRADSVGQDLGGYLKFYDATSSINSIQGFSGYKYEFGFCFLTKLINSVFNGNERAFIIITSIIILVGPCYLISKQSKNITYSVFLFVTSGLFFHSLCILRSWIAISILCFARIKMQERKNLQAGLLIALACTFHVSVLIYFFIYLVAVLWRNGKKMLVWFVGYILFFVFGTNFAQTILGINIFSRFVLAVDTATSTLSLVKVSFLLIPLFMSLTLRNFSFGGESIIEEELDEDDFGAEVVSLNETNVCIASWLQLLELSDSTAYRAVEIFALDAIILMPNVMSKVANRRFIYIFNICTVLVMLYYLYLQIHGGIVSGSFVYSFYWN